MKSAVLFLGCVSAGSIEISSTDLSGGNRALDNVKAKWSQTLKFLGNDATITGEYDRNVKSDFLSEATLSSSSGTIDYELKTNFEGGAWEGTFATNFDDGTKAEVEVSGLKGLSMPKIQKLTASRSTTLSYKSNSQDVDFELSHSLDSKESKLKMSTALGGGVKAVGQLVSGGKLGWSYEYESDLSESRKLSATVNPSDGSGDVEYVDGKFLDGTLTANIPFGGSPKVTYKRSFPVPF